MNLIKRIKRTWELSKKDQKILDSLTDEQIEQLPEIGDGNATFFGEGTHDEWEDQKKEDEGMKPWYTRLNNL